MKKYIAKDSAGGDGFTIAKGGEYDESSLPKEAIDSLVKGGLLEEVPTKPSDTKETTTNKTAANRETRGGKND